MMRPSNQRKLLEGVHDQEPVSGLTHNFYRYPARFSPAFARAVIEAFTKPGDLVYDPFMGGGTSLVESTVLGRAAVGTDISSLAVFVSRVKTMPMTSRGLEQIQIWAESVIPYLNVGTPAARASDWAELGYHKNISSRSTWRIRKLLEIAIAKAAILAKVREQEFARCILLRTAQWALDCRSDIPTPRDFREQFTLNSDEMIRGAYEYARAVHAAPQRQRPVCLERSAVGIDQEPKFPRDRPVSLVLTSPPYPGVHVLYHRWQIKGRKETAAPFWIASTIDGAGASFYTFGGRHQQELSGYYDHAAAAFKSIARICGSETAIVQMIAFAAPEWQLPRYLEAMDDAGFREVFVPGLANRTDRRVWRAVPGRKWYAMQRGDISASQEVVLFHKLRRS